MRSKLESIKVIWRLFGPTLIEDWTAIRRQYLTSRSPAWNSFGSRDTLTRPKSAPICWLYLSEILHMNYLSYCFQIPLLHIYLFLKWFDQFWIFWANACTITSHQTSIVKARIQKIKSRKTYCFLLTWPLSSHYSFYSFSCSSLAKSNHPRDQFGPQMRPHFLAVFLKKIWCDTNKKDTSEYIPYKVRR